MPVAPLSCQDDENGLQRRSRFFAPCDVRETVRLVLSRSGLAGTHFDHPAGSSSGYQSISYTP